MLVNALAASSGRSQSLLIQLHTRGLIHPHGFLAAVSGMWKPSLCFSFLLQVDFFFLCSAVRTPSLALWNVVRDIAFPAASKASPPSYHDMELDSIAFVVCGDLIRLASAKVRDTMVSDMESRVDNLLGVWIPSGLCFGDLRRRTHYRPNVFVFVFQMPLCNPTLIRCKCASRFDFSA